MWLRARGLGHPPLPLRGSRTAIAPTLRVHPSMITLTLAPPHTPHLSFDNSPALRAASATASAGLLTDARDKLALLEVMAVAAGSAAEGRAALTRPSVVGVLVDLACGRGELAASLGLRAEPVAHSVGDGPGGGTTQLRLRVLRKLQWLQLRVLCRGGVSGGGGGGGSADAGWLLHQQLQQPYLMRGRTLAMEVMAQLLQQRHVAELMQVCPGRGAGGGVKVKQC